MTGPSNPTSTPVASETDDRREARLTAYPLTNPWRQIDQHSVCDGCAEMKPLVREYVETSAWVCQECYADAATPKQMVTDFHDAFGYPMSACPAVPRDGLRNLRAMLSEQENAELIEAIDADDLVGVAQELADVVYVAYGTALTYGIDLDEVIAEVHRANMTKDVGTTGKAVKGERFVPADVKRVIHEQSRRYFERTETAASSLTESEG